MRRWKNGNFEEFYLNPDIEIGDSLKDITPTIIKLTDNNLVTMSKKSLEKLKIN